MSGTSLLGLTLAAIFERLDRIESALGITEPTPTQVEIDVLIEEEGH